MTGSIASRPRLAGVILMICATAGVAALVNTGASATSSSAPQLQAVPATFGQTFGVFARPQVTADQLPQAAAQTAGAATRRFGINPGLSRLALSSSGASAFLEPGNAELCMTTIDATGTGTACTTETEAISSDPFAVTEKLTAGYAVYALIPDGATGPTVTLEDGTQIPMTVGTNVGMATTPTAPATLSWTTAAGAHIAAKLLVP